MDNPDQMLWQHITNDNSQLFKQALYLMNTCGDAIALLEEYRKELESVTQRDSILLDQAKLQELDDKYKKIAKRWKEGKNE